MSSLLCVGIALTSCSSTDKNAAAKQAVEDMALLLTANGIEVSQELRDCFYEAVVSKPDDVIAAAVDTKHDLTGVSDPALAEQVALDLRDCMFANQGKP